MTINLSSSAHKRPIANRFFIKNVRDLPLWLIGLCFCFSGLAGANELTAQTLDLRTAVVRSLEQNPEIASIESRVKSADSYAKQASIGEKPQVSLTVEDALGSGDFSGLDNSQSTLSISWILERSLLKRQVENKLSESDLVGIEQEIKRYDVSAETAHAFLRALAFQERLRIAMKAAESAKRTLADIQKRAQSGKAPTADLLRAEVSLERRQLEIDDIIHELDVAKRVLAAQWGATSVDFSTLIGSLKVTDTAIDFSVLEQGIVESPRVKLFLTKERVKESEIALAKEQAKNRLRFNTGVRRLDSSDDYAMVVGVSMPFGGAKRNQNQINALTEEQVSYQADARAEQIKLSAELYGLFESFKHNSHMSEALETEIIPRLEKALVETRKAYELGRYSYREWSSVQQDVLAAKLELTDTRLAAHSNAVELERLTGQPISTTSISINNSTDLEQ
jgi:cobalt-zinc-cadmium efflux system outer membrane protein